MLQEEKMSPQSLQKSKGQVQSWVEGGYYNNYNKIDYNQNKIDYNQNKYEYSQNKHEYS